VNPSFETTLFTWVLSPHQKATRVAGPVVVTLTLDVGFVAVEFSQAKSTTFEEWVTSTTNIVISSVLPPVLGPFAAITWKPGPPLARGNAYTAVPESVEIGYACGVPIVWYGAVLSLSVGTPVNSDLFPRPSPTTIVLPDALVVIDGEFSGASVVSAPTL
jgi:hypothetical protein